jgi:hypothetical protein
VRKKLTQRRSQACVSAADFGLEQRIVACDLP